MIATATCHWNGTQSDCLTREEILLRSEVRQLISVLEASNGTSSDVLLATLAKLRDLGRLPPWLLVSTKVGIVVHSVAKDSALPQEVRISARTLVNSWRQNHRKRPFSVDRVTDRIAKRVPPDASKEVMPSMGQERNNLGLCSDGVAPTEFAAPIIVLSCAENKVALDTLPRQRAKVRQKLSEALSVEWDILQATGVDARKLRQPTEMALEIEHALHTQLSPQLDRRYMAQARSVIFNLKDAGNHALRRKVLYGTMSPHEFPKLTAEEMANDSRQAERANVRKESLQMVGRSEPEGEFVCEKCHGTLCRRTLGEVR